MATDESQQASKPASRQAIHIVVVIMVVTVVVAVAFVHNLWGKLMGHIDGPSAFIPAGPQHQERGRVEERVAPLDEVTHVARVQPDPMGDEHYQLKQLEEAAPIPRDRRGQVSTPGPRPRADRVQGASPLATVRLLADTAPPP